MPDMLDGEKPPLAIIADKAYDSATIRQNIKDEGALFVIPSRSNAKKQAKLNRTLYKMRHSIERFFCTMKDMRRLATRYEKLASNFLAMIHMLDISLCIN